MCAHVSVSFKIGQQQRAVRVNRYRRITARESGHNRLRNGCQIRLVHCARINPRDRITSKRKYKFDRPVRNRTPAAQYAA
jgi:hypothetical protein